MNKEAVGLYDEELQMFRETVREPNLTVLLFLRWLGEQGKLEHEIFGPSAGEYAEPIVQQSVAARAQESIGRR